MHPCTWEERSIVFINIETDIEQRIAFTGKITISIYTHKISLLSTGKQAHMTHDSVQGIINSTVG